MTKIAYVDCVNVHFGLFFKKDRLSNSSKFQLRSVQMQQVDVDKWVKIM